jgi:hypothetical protein
MLTSPRLRRRSIEDVGMPGPCVVSHSPRRQDLIKREPGFVPRRHQALSPGLKRLWAIKVGARAPARTSAVAGTVAVR